MLKNIKFIYLNTLQVQIINISTVTINNNIRNIYKLKKSDVSNSCAYL